MVILAKAPRDRHNTANTYLVTSEGGYSLGNFILRRNARTRYLSIYPFMQVLLVWWIAWLSRGSQKHVFAHLLNRHSSITLELTHPCPNQMRTITFTFIHIILLCDHSNMKFFVTLKEDAWPWSNFILLCNVGFPQNLNWACNRCGDG